MVIGGRDGTHQPSTQSGVCSGSWVRDQPSIRDSRWVQDEISTLESIGHSQLDISLKGYHAKDAGDICAYDTQGMPAGNDLTSWKQGMPAGNDLTSWQYMCQFTLSC